MTLSVINGPVIHAGQSLSDPVNCGGLWLLRTVMPDAWTKAPLTFQVSVDGVDYNDLYRMQDAVGSYVGYEVVVPDVAAGAVFTSPSGIGGPVNWIKLRSGTRNIPVAQAADRAFRLVLDNSRVPVPGPAGPAGPSGVPGSDGAPGPTGPTGTVGKGTILGDDAAPGMIGEVISNSNFGGVGLTTNVAMNVAQIQLTPGDWNVGGVVIFTPTSTGPNAVIAALSQTAAALPSDNDVATGKGIMQQIWASSMPSGKTQTTPTSLIRVNTNAAKPIYLVALATFGGGSVSVTGYISARRIR
jgi:hypothetical protein